MLSGVGRKKGGDMSQNELNWSFCNSETSFQSEEMTLEAAIAFSRNIPSTDREFWFAWQIGWEEWKSILDLEQFKEPIKTLSKPPPVPPRRHQIEPVITVPPPVVAATPPSQATLMLPAPRVAVPVSQPMPAVSEIISVPGAPPTISPPPAPAVKTATMVSETQATGGDRRAHPRHEFRFRVIIRNETLTFRTFTKDISLGGLSLENPVPEKLLDQKCQVFIGDPDSRENIRFALQSVGRPDRRYFSFSGVDEAMAGKLGLWIKAQVDKAGGKKAG
jgi:hypothetical protein